MSVVIHVLWLFAMLTGARGLRGQARPVTTIIEPSVTSGKLSQSFLVPSALNARY